MRTRSRATCHKRKNAGICCTHALAHILSYARTDKHTRAQRPRHTRACYAHRVMSSSTLAHEKHAHSCAPRRTCAAQLLTRTLSYAYRDKTALMRSVSLLHICCNAISAPPHAHPATRARMLAQNTSQLIYCRAHSE